MRQVLDEWNGGLPIGGQKISNLRYADDTVLIAKSEEELMILVDRLEQKSAEYGLSVNFSKTKIMIINRETENNPKPQYLGNYEVVDKFIYLGALISSDGSCEPEIRRRIQLGKAAMAQLTKIWRTQNITRQTKINLVHTLVFPVFQYAAETWTIHKADRRRIDAFEMWVWRRMLRIPWTARRTNISVLNEIRPKQRLSAYIYARILKFFGHITRANNMEKLVVQGKPDGKRRRGRSPTRWIDAVESTLNINMEQAVRLSSNRDRWRNAVRRATSRME